MAEPLISVLIPARGRPLELARCIRSLKSAAARDPAVEILVAIDDDDETFHRAPFLDADIRVLGGPRPATLGIKLNRLAASARGEILWFIADDYVMDTPGWPGRFRAAVARLDGGAGVLFPEDPLHGDHAAFPLIPRRMMAAVGYFAPTWFPFWFIDTWWDEIGILLGRRQQIDVRVSAPEGRGRSHAVFDVAFWAQLFEATRSMRVRDARRLAGLTPGAPVADGGADHGAANGGGLIARYALCARRMVPLHDPARIANWEDNLAVGERPARYQAVKAEAERLLAALRAGTMP